MFTVTFDRPVVDFRVNKLAISADSAGCARADLFDSGDHTTYSVGVCGMRGNCQVTLSIPAGVVHDSAGNANLASTSLDDGVAYTGSPSKTVFVSAASGSDSNDGLSWSTAKQTIGGGLGIASTGDEVWAAAGTYNEQAEIHSGIALYGGFAGGETQRGQANPRVNQTVLAYNGTVVSFDCGCGQSTVVDGVIIPNGANGVSAWWSSPTITNNIVDSYGTTLCNAIIAYSFGLSRRRCPLSNAIPLRAIMTESWWKMPTRMSRTTSRSCAVSWASRV